MTIGGAARTGATSMAMVGGLVLSIVLSLFLPLVWALAIAAGGALGLYAVLYIFSVAPYEEQFSQRMDSAREEATQQDEHQSATTDD